MKTIKEFPFDRARHVTATEVVKARKAIEAKLGKKRKSRGRPPKSHAELYRAVSIRLHPRIVIWAKSQAKKKHVGYQKLGSKLPSFIPSNHNNNAAPRGRVLRGIKL